MSDITESELRLPILLTHGNWNAWRAATSTKLKSESLWGLIDGWNTIPSAIPLPTAPTPVEDAALNAAAMVAYRSDLREYRHNEERILHWRQLNEKAEGLILKALDQDELNTLPEYRTAAELWNHLSTKHKEEYTGLAGYYIFYRLLRTPYNENDDMRKHIAYLRSQNELLGQSDPTQKLSDEMMGYILITSVSPSDKEWNGIISTLLANATPSKKITFNDVATRFTLEYDQRLLRTTAESNESNALAAKLAANTSKAPSGSKRPTCEHCGRLGHVKANCWTLHPEQRVPRAKEKATPKNARIAKAKAELKAALANTESESEEEHVANFASSRRSYALLSSITSPNTVTANANLSITSREEAYLDSGCSSSMTPNRHNFSSFVELKKAIPVTLGDGSVIPATGKGSVKYAMTVNNETVDVTLPMLYVPKLATTLVSVSEITERSSVRLIFEDSTCKAYTVTNGKRSDHIFTASNAGSGGLYRIVGAPITPKVRSNITSTPRRVDINVLHRRLGHLGFENIKRLVRSKMVEGIDEVTGDIEFCEACQEKQHRLPFPDNEFETSTPATAPLERIHTDVAGPLPISIGGKRYFMTIIDEFTRHPDIRFLKKKSEVDQSLRNWIAGAERFHERKVKCVRSDNGGEYISKSLQDFFAASGIRHETTAPDSPEQNGLAERMNRTIMDRVKAMMADGKFSSGFWAEIAETAVYLIKRSPATALPGSKTPYEAWSQKKPSVGHFRTIGCDAYAHVAKQHRKKLDSNTRKCKLLGYWDNSKAYRLWDPNARRVIKCRDVKFNEKQDKSVPASTPTIPPIFTVESEIEEIDTAPLQPKEEDIDDDESPPPLIALREEPAPRRRRTELEMLGPAPDVPETRVRRPTAKQREINERREVPAPVGAQPTTEDEDEIEPPIMETASFAFAMSAAIETILDDPKTLHEAMQRPDADKWETAVKTEFNALDNNNVLTECVLPPGRKAIGARFVLRVKNDIDGNPIRHKARLVAHGYAQRYGIDYYETFAPVARMSSIRMLLATGIQLGLHLHQYDFDTAYLNGVLDEEVYIRVLDDCDRRDKIYKLNRALYGLKQSGRVWHETLHPEFIKLGFTQLESEPCVYVYRNGSDLVIIVVYVDDMLIFGNNEKLMHEQETAIATRFRMRLLGSSSDTTQFAILGISIRYDLQNQKVELDQRQYIRDMARRYGLNPAKPANSPLSSGFKPTKDDCPSTDAEKAKMENKPYRSLIGSLQYAAQCTRPDICFPVGAMGKFSANPGIRHYNESIRILRFLITTQDLVITYHGSSTIPATISFTTDSDADWAGSDERKSTSGYIVTMAGGPVNWSSKLQGMQAMSSGEAEYIASANAGQEIVFADNFFTELGFPSACPHLLRLDSTSAIQWNNNPSGHSRTKHIDLKHHFTRSLVSMKRVKIKYIPSAEMLADVLTKPLGATLHAKAIEMLGMVRRSSGSVES